MATQCLKQTTAVALLLLFLTVPNSGQRSPPDQEGGTGGRSPEGGMDVGGRLAAPLPLPATGSNALCLGFACLLACSVQSAQAAAPTAWVGGTHQAPLSAQHQHVAERERPLWAKFL